MSRVPNKRMAGIAFGVAAAFLLGWLGLRSWGDREVDPGSLIGLDVDAVLAAFPSGTPTRQFQGWDLGVRVGPSKSYFPIDDRWLVMRVQDGTVVNAIIIED